MSGTTTEIPNRSAFNAADVCAIARVQPYVLRSWEAEFPQLGVAKTAGGPRIYRRADLEFVLKLKQLLFVDGLTLGGARRKLEEEHGPKDDDESATSLDAAITGDVRARLASVKKGLRAVLELLSRNGTGGAGPGAPAARAGVGGSPGRRERRAAPKNGTKRGQKATSRRPRG